MTAGKPVVGQTPTDVAPNCIEVAQIRLSVFSAWMMVMAAIYYSIVWPYLFYFLLLYILRNQTVFIFLILLIYYNQ
jgi:hypothetical protein